MRCAITSARSTAQRAAGVGGPRERLRPASRGRRERDLARGSGRRRRAARSRTTTRRTGSTRPTTPTERVAAAVEAARALDFPFTLTARAENHIRGNPDLDDTIARLQAYEEAGADVLFAPGLSTTEEIKTVCEAVSKPVNVLAFGNLTLDELAEAGAQRVSVGGSLTWVGVAAAAEAAQQIRDTGDFSPLRVNAPINEWLVG